MSTLEAILLGLIQGLTEFLPVSSSGHLEIAKALMDTEIKENVSFTVVLHFATALSTLVIFRNDILDIIKGLFSNNTSDRLFVLKIILSMIPAALVGVVFEEEIDALFTGKIMFVGFMLLLTALLLLLADRAKSTKKEVGIMQSILIGIAQAIAILPGISRSGATISSAVLLGIDKEKAARFSFLMVVPLIFGKIAKDLLDSKFTVENDQFSVYAFGFVAAFVSGLLACTWMIKLVKNSKLRYFSIYCLAVGLIAIGLYF
ncbi:MAG: undecaprenyl-diphosphate phosphatase [Flavobacteriales bacterium]